MVHRVEPSGIPTAFWRSIEPCHNVFVTESFMDELAAAARQEPVAYRLALLPAVTNAIFAATGKRLRKLSVDTLIGGDMRGGD